MSKRTKKSETKRVLRTPLFHKRVVQPKKGKGAYRRVKVND